MQAESYWAREIVTPEIDWLGDELCRRTNRPRAAFGSKGDTAHLRGAHRSQEWLLKSRFSTSRTYTVQSGLTAEQARHVAGVDFTPGSDTQMIAQCKRLLAAMKAGLLDEVVEFFGNVDGDQVVDGWDNVRDRAASSDSSHLWHWHLTIDRRHCRNRKLMERILAIVLGLTVKADDDMALDKGDKAIAWATTSRTEALLSGKPASYQIEGEKTRRTEPNRIAESLARIEAQLVTLSGRDFTDEPAIVQGVLAGLDPTAIAAAIPPTLARQVADELARRLVAE
ncbi:hypothetical protein [Micromonospora sp. NPDC050695]|uniref:hypothetical protein n=1 Tax=Micromonospora sp. NPDC050695 TaxID=3154938 RepID=UPI0033C60F69